jgi:hypothetical protein
MEATILTYQKCQVDDYEFLLKTEITVDEARNLKELKPLKLKFSQFKTLNESYRVLIFKNMENEWKILDKLSKYPTFGNVNNGKPIGIIGEGHLHETIDRKFMSEKPTGDLVIRGVHVRRYFVDLSPEGEQPRWVKREAFLKYKPTAKEIIIKNPKIIGREMVHRDEIRKLHFTIHLGDEILSNAIRYIIIEDNDFDVRFIAGLLNSQFLDWHFRLFSQTYHVKPYEIESLPIVRATPDQQAPIISLVDAIIQKKKEYHSISQNIEDYIDFSKVNLINLDEYLKTWLKDFEVLSSIKVKTDNFDALRVRIEKELAMVEYGIKRKIEEYKEIDEDEYVEVKGKYITEWNSAGKGEIKDIEAIEFLSKVLEGIKNFSKAKQKSIWQKIAEVKIPEFNEKVKEGFLKFKSAMLKAKELDEEILKIDRAIDRLVYDLYGLTEEEIQVVEKSVWGDKFEEMYSKLPSRENALKLAEEYKNG